MPIATYDLDHLLASTDAADFSARRALADVNVRIAKARKVVVVSGAGISCSSGIPDFRSADGLYALVKARYPNAFVTGKDLFSSGLFQNPETTSLFYTFIAELSLACQRAQPTRTHHFIARLESKGKLLRSYTQNVDGLERRLGLESGGRGKGLKKNGTRNVELHGDLGRVRCVLCFTDYEARQDWVEMFQEGDAPDCPACEERCSSRVSRSARATAVGSLRPSIVLYDEPHPLGDDIGALQAYDMRRNPDILLIMGTSLKVHGLKRLVKDFARVVHERKGIVVFVNATPPGKEWEGVIDVHVQGQTDRWADKVEEEWKRVRPQDWQTQTLLDGDVVQVPRTKANKKPSASCAYVQLPTPPPSQSICASSSPCSSPLSSLPSSPRASSPAPPTPVSPSKRRATVANEASKKTKPAPPRTGLPGTPGRGNLFASPAKALNILRPAASADDLFGSPTRETKPVRAAPAPAAKTRVTRSAVGKENAPPRPTRRAAAKA
ncbi:NAD-dependent deacetylase hst3 [Cryptotrichosporon argae]